MTNQNHLPPTGHQTFEGIEEIKKAEKSAQEIIKLAQEEKALRLLGAEIEKTRRRVNALEYVLIPDIKETIKYIDMKLIEQERSVISSLMRIKEVIS